MAISSNEGVLTPIGAADLVRVTDDDTTPGFLDNKISVSGSLGKNKINSPGDEDLQIVVSTVQGVWTSHSASHLASVTYGSANPYLALSTPLTPPSGGTFNSRRILFLRDVTLTAFYVILGANNLSGGETVDIQFVVDNGGGPVTQVPLTVTINASSPTGTAIGVLGDLGISSGSSAAILTTYNSGAPDLVLRSFSVGYEVAPES